MAKSLGAKGQAKVAKVMREAAAGKLHSGSDKGPKVSAGSPQAKAIAMSEGRKASKGKY
jgi:hypothetical protein